jgi:hypothetical protein
MDALKHKLNVLYPINMQTAVIIAFGTRHFSTFFSFLGINNNVQKNGEC